MSPEERAIINGFLAKNHLVTQWRERAAGSVEDVEAAKAEERRVKARIKQVEAICTEYKSKTSIHTFELGGAAIRLLWPGLAFNYAERPDEDFKLLLRVMRAIGDGLVKEFPTDEKGA